jgi:hypothetical protein
MDCPEMTALAAFAESCEGPAELMAHVRSCDACQEALEALQEEVLSLQIPLGELWFRHHVSCPSAGVLRDFRMGSLDPEAADYVRFHMDELSCHHCQARLGELDLGSSREGRGRVEGSRARVGEATSRLLRDLRGRG